MATPAAWPDDRDPATAERVILRYGFSTQEARVGDRDLQRAWEASRNMLALEEGVAHEFLCPICRVPSPALVEGGLDGSREQFRCVACGMNSRQRAGVSILMELVAPGLVIATEQLTSAFLWLQRKLPNVEGGEYEPREEMRNELTERLHQMGGTGRVQYQDVTRLQYNDGSAAGIISFDVLEHVPDYPAALSEFARVLKPGGVLVATFPFLDAPETSVRARIDPSGDIEHLLPPEYHGDPISEGVLCFYHFGWDILERARASGFAQAEMVMPWSPVHGLHYGLWTLICTK